MRCDTPGAVTEAVRGNMGVGILYRDVVANNIDRHEFEAIKMPGDTPEGKSYIVHHKHKPITPSAQAFLELLPQEKTKSR
jgi:DNA-binding transcriptional LysR family regulator